MVIGSISSPLRKLDSWKEVSASPHHREVMKAEHSRPFLERLQQI